MSEMLEVPDDPYHIYNTRMIFALRQAEKDFVREMNAAIGVEQKPPIGTLLMRALADEPSNEGETQ